MGSKKAVSRPATSTQDAQKVLVAEAQKMPGVAEVIELYAKFSPYVPSTAPATVIVRHSTGGNV
jgi:hypothetical protein